MSKDFKVTPRATDRYSTSEFLQPFITAKLMTNQEKTQIMRTPPEARSAFVYWAQRKTTNQGKIIDILQNKTNNESLIREIQNPKPGTASDNKHSFSRRKEYNAPRVVQTKRKQDSKAEDILMKILDQIHFLIQGGKFPTIQKPTIGDHVPFSSESERMLCQARTELESIAPDSENIPITELVDRVKENTAKQIKKAQEQMDNNFSCQADFYNKKLSQMQVKRDLDLLKIEDVEKENAVLRADLIKLTSDNKCLEQENKELSTQLQNNSNELLERIEVQEKSLKTEEALCEEKDKSKDLGIDNLENIMLLKKIPDHNLIHIERETEKTHLNSENNFEPKDDQICIDRQREKSKDLPNVSQSSLSDVLDETEEAGVNTENNDSSKKTHYDSEISENVWFHRCASVNLPLRHTTDGCDEMHGEFDQQQECENRRHTSVKSVLGFYPCNTPYHHTEGAQNRSSKSAEGVVKYETEIIGTSSNLEIESDSCEKSNGNTKPNDIQKDKRSQHVQKYCTTDREDLQSTSPELHRLFSSERSMSDVSNRSICSSRRSSISFVSTAKIQTQNDTSVSIKNFYNFSTYNIKEAKDLQIIENQINKRLK